MCHGLFLRRICGKFCNDLNNPFHFGIPKWILESGS